jgi:hypothetical protein
MAKRRTLLWGLLVAAVVPVVALAVIAVCLMLSYDGTCGGMMPWLAAAKPCPRAQYVRGTLFAVIVIVWTSYWPIILGWVGVSGWIGYLMGRRGNLTGAGADRGG